MARSCRSDGQDSEKLHELNLDAAFIVEDNLGNIAEIARGC